MGAAGRIGSVGGAVVAALRQRGLPVRALVRRDDERAAALRATDAEVVVGDLTRAADVASVMASCRRLYFGMSVSPLYLEATVLAAAVARARGDLEMFVNMSQRYDPAAVRLVDVAEVVATIRLHGPLAARAARETGTDHL